ncbi:MAG: transporter substrate-binding protein [Sneathiellaceae bacterium]
MGNQFKVDRRVFLKGTAAGASTAAIASMFPFVAEAADEIAVGGIHDESGFLDIAGQPMSQVLRFAVAEKNKAGGLLGKQIKLYDYDSQSNMQLYSQYAQQLALKDKASVVFGGITSASREVIRPVLRRYKTLYFYDTLYEGGVCDRNQFATGTTPAQTVEKLVPFVMKKWGGKKIYTLAADYNYGQITADWVKKYVRENGGEILATDYFPLDVTNFGPTISKVQEAKPDILISVLVGSAHLAFYRQWAAAGMMKQIPIAATTFGAGGNEVVLMDPSESDGMINALGYFQEIETPENTKWKADLKAFFGDKMPLLTELSCCTYEGFQFWTKAVEMAGTLDRMKVIEALETGMSIDGPSGKVTIEPKTHHTIRNVYVAEINDRKWQVLETYDQVPPQDTMAVCDLEKNPDDTTMYVIKLDE